MAVNYGPQIKSLAEELAKAAGITPAQATRVLDLLKVRALVENVATLQQTLNKPAVARALQLGEQDSKRALKELSFEQLRLTNVVVALRPADTIIGLVA
jgi:hypothetical protein